MSKTARQSTQCARPIAPGFHLLASRREENTRDVVHVPERVTYLVRDSLAPRARKPARKSALRLEPIECDGERALLASVSPAPGTRLRVRRNGLPLPPVAVLHAGDELFVGDGAPLLVTEYRRPRVETPTGRLLEQDCGLCRLRLTRETRVLVHKCGVALHLEPETTPEEERLVCATAGDCPSCGRPVETEEGYTWLPA